MKTVLLVGNYGVGNLGDEALKEYFVRRFQQVQWRVVSAQPTGLELPRLPGGLRSLFSPWWKTLRALKRADAVVFGGGSLFTDVESLYACLLWWWHVFICHGFGRPVHLAFQGIGPFRSGIAETVARSAVGMAATVSVRDMSSYERVKAWNMNKKIVLAFDPVYGEILALKRENLDSRTKNMFIILPRSNPSTDFIKVLRSHLGREFQRAHIVSLQPDLAVEQKVCAEIAQQINVPVDIVPVRTLRELVAACHDGTFILTQRFHGALLAYALGIPLRMVPQGQDDKLEALQHERPGEWSARIKAGEEALRQALQ